MCDTIKTGGPTFGAFAHMIMIPDEKERITNTIALILFPIHLDGAHRNGKAPLICTIKKPRNRSRGFFNLLPMKLSSSCC